MKAESVYYSITEPKIFLNAFSRQDFHLKFNNEKSDCSFLLLSVVRRSPSWLFDEVIMVNSYTKRPHWTQQRKILLSRLSWKNLSNIAINFFFAKKASDWIYIMSYPQMSNFSEQKFTTETFRRGLVCELTKSTKLFTCSKHVKLPLVSFFELRFLRNVSSEP